MRARRGLESSDWATSDCPWPCSTANRNFPSPGSISISAKSMPPDVAGQHVVADDAPVFGPVGLDDVVVVQVLQGGPVPGFALLPVGGSFRLDHIERHPQRHVAVGRPAAAGDLGIAVLDDDLIAE